MEMADFTAAGALLMANETDNNVTTFVFSASDQILLRVSLWLFPLILFAALLVNGTYLLAFCLEKHLRSDFNYYLINAVVANLIYALSIPHFMAMNYYGYWPLGQDYCFFHLWLACAIHPGTVQADMLIGLNRVWAVYWPFHYRRHNSRKVTLRIIAASWIWVQMTIVPVLVVNHMRSNTDPIGIKCDLEIDTLPMRVWLALHNFFNYCIPEGMLLSSFFLIYWRTRHQARARGQLRISLSIQSSDSAAAAKEQSVKDHRLFRMLGYLTISFLFCTLPANIFWFIYSVDSSVYSLSLVHFFTMLIFSNTVIRPLMYQTGSSELRWKILQILQLNKDKRPFTDSQGRLSVTDSYRTQQEITALLRKQPRNISHNSSFNGTRSS